MQGLTTLAQEVATDGALGIRVRCVQPKPECEKVVPRAVVVSCISLDLRELTALDPLFELRHPRHQALRRTI